jgi:hypothetical protein
MGSIHRPLVTIAPRWYPPRDGDAAEHDAQLQWVRHCTVCGGGEGIMHQSVVYLSRLTVFAVQCSQCRHDDPGLRRLHAMLMRRYKEGLCPQNSAS